MNRTASAKAMLKLNSPASVLGMLAPHIEFPWLNRRKQAGGGSDRGNRERIVHRAQAQHGREREQEDAEDRHPA
jgi:hypothetical protein